MHSVQGTWYQVLVPIHCDVDATSTGVQYCNVEYVEKTRDFQDAPLQSDVRAIYARDSGLRSSVQCRSGHSKLVTPSFLTINSLSHPSNHQRRCLRRYSTTYLRHNEQVWILKAWKQEK
jgi:hypothetical protein